MKVTSVLESRDSLIFRNVTSKPKLTKNHILAPYLDIISTLLADRVLKRAGFNRVSKTVFLFFFIETVSNAVETVP